MKRIKFVRDRRGYWIWHGDRPYKGVRIDIHKSCEYMNSATSSRIKPRSIRYYACLQRVGAPRLGPGSSHPDIFVNCSDYGEEFATRAAAQRQAIEWVDAGWPKETAEAAAARYDQTSTRR